MSRITSNVIEIICKDCGYRITPKEYIKLHPPSKELLRALKNEEQMHKQGKKGGVLLFS